jgi:hypothetical protein
MSGLCGAHPTSLFKLLNNQPCRKHKEYEPSDIVSERLGVVHFNEESTELYEKSNPNERYGKERTHETVITLSVPINRNETNNEQKQVINLIGHVFFHKYFWRERKARKCRYGRRKQVNAAID